MTKLAADPDRLITDLTEMIATPSVNPFDDPPTQGQREQEFAEYLLGKFTDLGLETGRREVVSGRPNVWGRLKGRSDGPSLMLVGHMDTVGVEGYPEGLEPVHKNGRVYGRGACDMKAAFACYLETVRLLIERDIPLNGDLIIAGLCDEEHLMIGSTDWGKHGPHADFGIIGEPTGLKICTAHKGQLTFKITTHGKAVHSSAPENGVNAVEHMGAVIARLAPLNRDIQDSGPTHPLCGQGRFSMNVIRGGTISSAIPDRCEMEVDRRYFPGEEIGEILAGCQQLLRPLEEQIPAFHATVGPPILDVKPLDIAADAPIVVAIVKACQSLSLTTELSAFPGGTDAPNMGFPCVVCGPGNLEQAHTRNEYVDVGQLTKATELYLHTACHLTDDETMGFL